MKIKAITIGLMLALSGCSSTDNSSAEAAKEVQSGFLSSYDQLKKVDSSDDSDLVRYIKPGLKELGYDKVILDPVSFYPGPKSTDKVSKEVLSQISSYANKAFSDAVSASSTLATAAGPNTARMKVAITAVDITDKELSGMQYIPIAFLFTAASGGLNDMQAKLRIEAEMVDSQTGEVLMQGIKSGSGATVEDDKASMNLEMLSPLLDKWAETMKATLSEDM